MNCAIVGCGGIAQVHAYVLSEIEDIKLVAFADIVIERAAAMAEQYGGKAYESLEEMIEKEQIDVLHICTPHYLHTPMALYARDQGIHVFMEKPPSISREEFKQLSNGFNKTKLGICFQNRYNKSVQYIKELLKDGKAGAIKGGRAILTWARDEHYYTDSHWRGSVAKEGGGVLINQAIHTLDLLTYLIGKPVGVEASASNHHLKNKIEVEDTIEAYIDFDGKVVNFYATNAYYGNSPVLIELICEHMTIRMEETEVTCITSLGDKWQKDFKQIQGPGKNYWGNGHKECIQDYYICLSEGREFCIQAKDVAVTMDLMYGIYESAKTGECIQLDGFH